MLDGSVVRLDETSRSLVLEELLDMSSNALRCLGLAYKADLSEFADYDGEHHPAHKLLLDPSNYSSIESNLIFVGLVGLRVRIPFLLLLLFLFAALLVLLWHDLESFFIPDLLTSVGSSSRRR